VKIVKVHRRAVLLVLGLALLLVPVQQPAAAPGVGSVVVTPNKVAAGSTNTFKLTFTADTGPLQGQTLLDIPRGWSLPQNARLGVTGYVALAPETCTGTKLQRVSGYRLTIATNCRRGQSFTLTYGPATASTLAADGYVFLTQTKPNVGVTATKLVKVKTVVKTKKGKRRTKLTTKRVKFVVKPTLRPLAPKKQPVVVVTGGPIDHLTVNAPTIATAGTPFSVTVRAEDAFGNTASGYNGTVSFSSSDPDAFLPTPYQFTATDAGAKTFGNVILRATGTQTITASDNGGRVDPSNPITVYSF
jgi:hypothetical protein